MPRHPLLSRSLLSLALGLLTTIAIAWLLVFVPLETDLPRVTLYTQHTQSASDAINFMRGTALGADRYTWAPLSPLDPATDFDDVRASWGRFAAENPSLCPLSYVERPIRAVVRPQAWPLWPGFPRGPLGSADPTLGRSTDIRGLPFPALASWTPVFAGFRTGLGPPVHAGIPIRAPDGSMTCDWAALPLRPVLPGFILDVIIWSLLWLVAITAFINGRAQSRARRGLCPRCAYSREGLAPDAPCPECGARVARPAPSGVPDHP